MALQKQSLSINFNSGIDTKPDPFQIAIGKFADLRNATFSKNGRLEKRNGFEKLTALPVTDSTVVTTFNDNLTAIGSSLYAYSSGAATWVNKGAIQPLELETLPMVRSSTNQTQSDSATAPNGLVCTVFTDVGSSTAYKYSVLDSTTGQVLSGPATLTPSSGTLSGSPKVFVLGNYFVIVVTNNVSGTYHLQYFSIRLTAPTSISAATDISTSYTPATTVAFDGVVANSNLYLAWNGSDGGGAIRMTYIDSTLTQHNTVTFATRVATIMSVTADTSGSTPVVWAAFYNSGSSTGYALAVNPQLTTILAATQIISSGTVLNITSSASGNTLTFFYEVSNTYSYSSPTDSSTATNLIRKNTITSAGTLGTSAVLVRSAGLASKSFIVSSTMYFLGIYSSSYQPTYFLFNSSGTIVGKLAYSNGGSYFVLGLPSVTVSDTTARVSYLLKDLIVSVSKAVGGTNNTTGLYSQTGVNLASFTIGTSKISTSEIAQDLHLSGGFLYMYDGSVPVEHGFHVWPDHVGVSTSGAGGSITAQDYYYVAVYEWTDNQGNIHRSAPSIPVKVTTTGATSTNTVKVPTLRLTAKTLVKIVIYRYSTAQPVFYQATSLTSPTLNDTTADSVTFSDTQADATILGNSVLYTTGGVVENIGAPACTDLSLFKSRMFLVDAEDGTLWFSKQVIQNTPVEMSDLFTKFVAPTIGAQGSTGKTRCTVPMDDKLIMFKADAAYYMTGNGPDNTGANDDFSEPIFINSTVGCSNKQSIVFIPQGLMFQSDKGIWLLGRDLSTQYIGAPVEAYNEFEVLSAVNVPGTNEVRFTLSNGVTLMYDYFNNQWGTFTGIPAVSSTLFQGLHTFINSAGDVYQEDEGSYIDGSRPVEMSFTTGWINVAGLQGFERIYALYLLGSFISPHKLTVSIAFDYAPGPEQVTTITPDNYSPAWGGDNLWGGSSVWGGAPSLEQWRVFLSRQKCQAFQVTVQESFDPSYSTNPGAGLTLSGLNLLIGTKSTYPRIKAANSVG